MKLKLYPATVLLCAFTLFTHVLYAQHCAGASGSTVCTANSSITTVGFFPPSDSLPCAVIGSAYDQIVQFHTPSTVTQGTSTYNLNWVRIDTVSNLPCGLCWRSGSSTNQINGNATGCIRVTGTTYDAPGQYKLHVIVSANVQIGIFPFTVGNQDAEALGLRYYVRVADLSGNCAPVDTLSAGRTATTGGSIAAATITGPSAFCSGGNATLSINAANYYAYKWSTGAITSSINVTAAGTYTVTAYAACTSVTASKTITINPAPTASISPATATICSGTSATLTASGGTSYVWNTAATTAAITVNPVTTTTYTVTVTGANTCTATASRQVTVNTPPTASILPATAAICTGGSATLTASGGTGYTWNTTATTAAITVSPSSTTTYTVTVSDANSCTASVSRQVTVNSLPTATISPASVTICSGNSATLTAGGGTNYTWNTSATSAAITVSPVSTTTYTVTVTDANTCSATAARIVNVNTPVTASISPASATVCAGVSTTLNATAGSSYAWSNGAATQAIAVTPANTTTYSVTVTDANSCTSTASSVVTVNPAPNAGIAPANAAICAGGSATLTASGGSSYIWNDNSTNAALTVSPANTSTYSVTVTDNNNCSVSVSRTVTVNPLPLAGISPATTTICEGSSATLAGSGGLSYVWSDNSTSSTLVVNPTQQSTYSVTATDANNCSASATAQVNVNALPAASVSPSTQAICNGNTTTLTAGGGTSYAWSTGSINPTINVTPTATTTYTVTVTNINNCTASAIGSVTVNNNPVASINTTADTICNGNSSTLTASGGTAYVWSDASTNAALTVSPAGTSTYSVTVSNATNCSATATTTISVITVNATITANGPTTFCAGGSVTLDAGAGFDSYNWSNGATTQTITASSSGNFTCTVTQNGCTGISNTVVVTETANNLSPVLSATPSLNICPGGSALLDAGAGYDTYTWSTSANSQTISTASAGTYTVTVTSGTCSGTASAQVAVGNFPVAVSITPAGPVSVCAGTSVTLDGGNGYDDYNWSTGAATQTIQPSQTATYSLTVTKDFCTGSSSVQVTINPLPTAAISPASSTICAGASTTLTASGGNNYLWSDNSTTATLVVAPSGNSTYSVTVTDANQCTASATTTVAVNTLPTATIAPSTLTVCRNEPFSFTATGGTSYSWSDGANTAQINGTANTSIAYTLTVTDANQCTASAGATLTVNQLPTAAISPQQPSVCSGQSTTLTASGNGSYLWSDNSTATTLTVSPVSDTNYSVTVTDGNNCSASAATTVTVTNLVATISANGPTTFCSGGSVTLNATPAGATYLWSNGGTTDNITVTSSGTYNSSISLNGCTAVSNDITVTVIPSTVSVSIAASPSLNICAGGVSVLDAGTGYATYLWSTGSTTHLIAADSTGSYTVTVTQGGCAATAAATVNVGVFPVNATINPSGAQACSGDSILLDAGNSHQQYSWSNGSSSPQIFVLNTGSYTVTVTDANACSGTASASVLFNSRPQPAITPAGAQTICAGQSIPLSADATYDTYSWNTGAVSASIVATAAGNYSITVTQNGCSGYTTSPVTVTVNPLPIATVTPATSNVCSGSSATLTAAGGTSYVWDDASTQAIRTVIPTNLTNYTVTVTDGNGCSASASAAVGINPSPSVTILSSEPSNIICAGTNVDLYATGGSSFTWSTGATGASISVTPGSTNTYAVTVTDANNCSGASSQTIVVNSLPVPSVTSTQVGGGSDYLLQATPAGLTGYIWQQAVANDTTNQLHFNYPTNTDTFTANCVTNGGYYRVLVTDANGCSAASGYVTVPFCTAINELPQLVHFGVMPNPANDVLTVVYELNSDTQIKLTVLDITGRVVTETDGENQAAGKHKQQLSLTGITSGIYLLNFTTGKGSFNTRFIKE